VRSVSAAVAAGLGHEAREFAATVAAAVRDHRAVDAWTPGAAVSDADPALAAALAAAGWEELAREELLALVGPAAVELGRGLTTLAPVDRLLGGPLRAGRMARYAGAGDVLVEPRAGRMARTRAARLEPLPYTDALGVVRVEAAGAAGELDGAEAHARMAAWMAGSAGYLAGLAAEALQLALEHARARIAFGRPLTALEPVQQMLADAATLVDGLELLAHDRPGADALAHAGAAAELAVATCMQVTGALGFTLEFPLQRAQRRARAARAWADAVLAAWEPAP
jgi:hypothetical protein